LFRLRRKKRAEVKVISGWSRRVGRKGTEHGSIQVHGWSLLRCFKWVMKPGGGERMPGGGKKRRIVIKNHESCFRRSGRKGGVIEGGKTMNLGGGRA